RYDIVFRHPRVPGVPLELHYEVARWQERPKGLDARRLWASRRAIDVLGEAAWGLPPELELVGLIAHAAKRFHLFNRLVWSVDLTVVTDTSAIDWEAFARLARDAHCRIAAAVALRLARRLGADVPDELLTLPGFLRRTGAVDPLLDPARPFSVRAMPHRRIAYVLVDDIAGKARLALGDLLRPPSGQPRTRVARNVVRALERSAARLARTGFGRR
ncbi:MAG: nucleotidyltransferase family protein, partial [Actinomycetota bacterium]